MRKTERDLHLPIPDRPFFEARERAATKAPRRLLLALAALCFCAGSAGIAHAQDGEGTAPAAPCKVQPGDTGSGAGSAEPNSQAADPSLADCNGVLKPPTIGDQELVEPPAAGGRTPVIPPGTAPVQPPG